MNTIEKMLQKKIKNLIMMLQRLDYKIRFLRNNDNFTIISNNCIAGFLYHDLAVKNNSPTIGLQFPPKDFVKFCKSFSYYIQKHVTESRHYNQKEFSKLGGGKINFPVGKLGDLTIFFQHYQNIDEAIKKWEDRTKRINLNKLFFVFVAHDSTPDEILREFNSITYPNKIILTNSSKLSDSNVFALHNGETPWFERINVFGKKFYQKYDFKSWIYNGYLNN